MLHQAVYYSNRAFRYIRLEQYGLAIEDGNKALEIDPNYTKVSISASYSTPCMLTLHSLMSSSQALYRRADAHLAIGKYQIALRDLNAVLKRAPKDENALKKKAEYVALDRMQHRLFRLSHTGDLIDLLPRFP